MINGIKGAHVVTPEGIITTNIKIEEGKISELTNEDINGIHFDQTVYVVPGFIDEHIHGVNSSDTMDGEIDTLINISKSLAKEGTTSYLPTTMTQSKENILKSLENIHQYMKHHNHNGAEVLGVHLEGPFINKRACGAQPEQYIINPDIELLKEFNEASGNAIKLVTVAPEVPGGFDFIKYCQNNHIVASIGHTKATYDETKKAIENGASSVTHCFNAMTGLHHREVGVVGATLLHDELDAELIADGIHVNKHAINILYQNKGKDKITLVTDSMRAKALEDGEYELGGQVVNVVDGQARLVDGTLAGSVLKMNDALKNMISFLNLSLEEAIVMASTNPAKKLGVYERKGSIQTGKDADLVILDEHYNVIMTICRGTIEYQRQ